MKLSIIIPVFNEERTIRMLIEQVFKAVKDLNINAEIIVVNDGSTDNTLKVLQAIKNGRKLKFELINLKKNSGKGSAIKVALPLVRGDYILIQDADLEYSPVDNYQLLIEPVLNSKSEVVFGSRALGHNKRNIFWLPSVFLTKFFNLLFGTNLSDFSTCYKLFPSFLIEELLEIKDNDFSFDVFYLTFLVTKHKLPILEVPIIYKPRRENKKLELKHGFKIFFCMIKTFLKAG